MSLIPFNKPYVTGRELEYINQALINSHTSGDGEFSKKCQALMQDAFSAQKVLLTTSCTAALEMGVLLSNLKPGDEVILPSFTFVSTANAFVLHGITPRFVDIRPDTKNLNENLIEEAVCERTKAIMPVHYAGVGCEMDAIMQIAQKYELAVIEDAAQGVDAKYKNTFLGTIGTFGAYSFHETKNYSSGEGGALVINDEDMVERAEILREKGTNRTKFSRGEIDKYTWVDIGSSYLPSDILAALLYAQLESMDKISSMRKRIYRRYLEQLEPLANEGLIELPVLPEECRTNYHMFYILAGNLSVRTALLAHLRAKGIHAVFHYVPLHNSPMGKKLACDGNHLPVTDQVSERLLRLPFYCELSEQEIDTICNEIRAFYKIR